MTGKRFKWAKNLETAEGPRLSLAAYAQKHRIDVHLLRAGSLHCGYSRLNQQSKPRNHRRGKIVILQSKAILINPTGAQRLAT